MDAVDCQVDLALKECLRHFNKAHILHLPTGSTAGLAHKQTFSFLGINKHTFRQRFSDCPASLLLCMCVYILSFSVCSFTTVK